MIIPFIGIIRAVILTALLIGPLAYMKGCKDESDRFASFRSVVKVMGESAERSARARIEQNKRISKEVQDENSAALRKLADLYGGLLNARPRASVLPTPRPAPAGTETKVCYSRDILSTGMEAALRDFEAETYGILRKGDEALIDRTSWGVWADRVGVSDPIR